MSGYLGNQKHFERDDIHFIRTDYWDLDNVDDIMKCMFAYVERFVKIEWKRLKILLEGVAIGKIVAIVFIILIFLQGYFVIQGFFGVNNRFPSYLDVQIAHFVHVYLLFSQLIAWEKFWPFFLWKSVFTIIFPNPAYYFNKFVSYYRQEFLHLIYSCIGDNFWLMTAFNFNIINSIIFFRD